MHFENMGWGGWMMLAGMGTVFLLLAILMGVLLLIGVFDKQSMKRQELAAARDAAAAPAVEAAPVAQTAPAEIEAAPVVEILHDGLTRDQVAAISLAVITHARVRRAQAAPAMRSFQPGSHLYASRWVSVGRGLQNKSWRRN